MSALDFVDAVVEAAAGDTLVIIYTPFFS